MPRRLARTALFALVGAFFLIAALWPAREDMGRSIERLARWWNPPAKRPIARARMGARRRALMPHPQQPPRGGSRDE